MSVMGSFIVERVVNKQQNEFAIKVFKIKITSNWQYLLQLMNDAFAAACVAVCLII